MQRFSGASPVSSPNRPNYSKSSPLARVTEERAPPIRLSTNGIKPEKLVEVETPRPSEDTKDPQKAKALDSLLESSTPIDDDKENKKVDSPAKTNGLTNGALKKTATVEDDDTTMKTIEI